MFDLLDEIADVLALDVCPMNWPIGMGGEFEGVLDLVTRRIGRPEGDSRGFPGQDPTPTPCCPTASPRRSSWRRGRLCQHSMPRRNRERRPDPGLFRLGAQGFRCLTRTDRGARRLCAEPHARAARRTRAPCRPTMAARSPASCSRCRPTWTRSHRDRIAFMRLCSGSFQTRHEVDARQAAASRSRSTRRSCSSHRIARLADEAFPGDIIGIPNHGTLRVGDTLSRRGADVRFTGLPNFAPEILRRVILEGFYQVETVAQGARRHGRGGGYAGVLSRDRLELDHRRRRPAATRRAAVSRLDAEYKVAAGLEPAPFDTARWVSADDAADLKAFHRSSTARRWRRTATAIRCFWRRVRGRSAMSPTATPRSLRGDPRAVTGGSATLGDAPYVLLDDVRPGRGAGAAVPGAGGGRDGRPGGGCPWGAGPGPGGDRAGAAGGGVSGVRSGRGVRPPGFSREGGSPATPARRP